MNPFTVKDLYQEEDEERQDDKHHNVFDGQRSFGVFIDRTDELYAKGGRKDLLMIDRTYPLLRKVSVEVQYLPISGKPIGTDIGFFLAEKPRQSWDWARMRPDGSWSFGLRAGTK